MPVRMKLNKQERIIFHDLLVGDKCEIVENPFSKIRVELPPRAVAVYDLVKGAEQEGEGDLMQTGLDIFAKNWPAEYMALLD